MYSLIQTLIFPCNFISYDKVFQLFPTHPVWQRERNINHGGAFRFYNDPSRTGDDDVEVFMPSKTQMKCKICLNSNQDDDGGAKEVQHVSNINSYFEDKKEIVSKNTFARGKNKNNNK